MAEGAVVLPPVPAFYNRPQTLDDIVNHSVGKALDQFGIEHRLMKLWKEPAAAEETPAAAEEAPQRAVA